jgi:hypothetical protein
MTDSVSQPVRNKMESFNLSPIVIIGFELMVWNVGLTRNVLKRVRVTGIR